LASMAAHGANIWAYWNIMYDDGRILESLDSGLGRYDQIKSGRIDQLINWSEEHDMIMMFAIWPHDLLSNTVWAHQWHENPYKNVTSVIDFYGSEEAWQYQEKQYRYIIARWGYSRAMGIWEIVNEINGTDGWQAGRTSEARLWVRKVHEYFKENDPMNRPTTASQSGGIYWSQGYEEVDLPNVHLYETGWGMEYPGNPLRSSAYIYNYVARQFWSDFDKPGILGEAGYTDSYGNFATPSQQYTELYHNALWASWAGGLATTPFWWSYQSRNIMSDDVMDQLLSFSRIVLNHDFTSQNVHPVMLEVENGDGYAMNGENTAYGWIRHEFGDPVQGKKAKIIGLQDTSYTLSWYDPWAGNLLVNDIVLGLNNEIEINTPPEAEDLPDIAFFLEPAEEGVQPSQLRLRTASRQVLVGNPQSVKLTCTIHDDQNRFCGKSDNIISYQLKGPGTLMGENPQAAENGISEIYFQPDSSLAGTVQIIASAEGLSDDTVHITITNEILIDNFDSYQSLQALQTSWQKRAGTSANVLLYKAQVYDGQHSMLVQYAIGDGNAPFSGIYKNLDLAGEKARSLNFWLKPDGSNRTLAILLNEVDGRYWQYDIKLSDNESTVIEVPLKEFQASDGSESEIDLHELDEISFNILKGEGEFGTSSIVVDAISFIITDVGTTIEENNEIIIPQNHYLYQNYPNPFNPVTTIRYMIGAGARLTSPLQVELSIYNLLGQKITTLVSEKQPPGTYTIEWNASGRASGIYYTVLMLDNKFIQSRKLIYLR